MATNVSQSDIEKENRRASLIVSENLLNQGDVQGTKLRSPIMLESVRGDKQITPNESMRENICESSKGRQGQGIEDTLMSELNDIEGMEGSEGNKKSEIPWLMSGEGKDQPLELRVPLRDCSNLQQLSSMEGAGRKSGKSKGQWKRRARLQGQNEEG